MFQKNRSSKYSLCGIRSIVFLTFYNPFAKMIRFFCPDQKIKSFDSNLNILLCSQASLGDVFLACFVIPALKQHFPNSQIGFLCTPKSSPVLKTQKDIDFIHELDRWDFLKRQKVTSEIRKKNYQISLELHPFFPNSIPLARKAKIPCRIGFDAGGFDVWLTNPVSFPKTLNYLPLLYTHLLKELGIFNAHLQPNLTLPSYLHKEKLPAKYLVLHIGTSDPFKEWEIQKWKELAQILKKNGHTLVFTGCGTREKTLICEAFEGLGLNLCDKLDWSELVFTLKNATALISVDSAPVHVAAFYQIPLIALYLYNQFLELWLPNVSTSALLISKKCVRRNQDHFHPKALYLDEITVADVLHQMENILPHD